MRGRGRKKSEEMREERIGRREEERGKERKRGERRGEGEEEGVPGKSIIRFRALDPSSVPVFRSSLLFSQ